MSQPGHSEGVLTDPGIGQTLAVMLVAITGLIHVYIGVTFSGLELTLAGGGFFAGLGLFLLNIKRRWLYGLAIPYTLAQMVLWLEQGLPFVRFGLVDKFVQIVLVLLCGYLFVKK